MSKSAAEEARVESLISLALMRGLGTKALLRLLECTRNPAEALRKVKRRERTRRGEVPEEVDKKELEKAITFVERERVEVVSILDSLYPAPLREIHTPPPVLFLLGDPTCLDSISVAVVGTRRATGYGKRVARRLGRELSMEGITVVSGMARGIDTEAHHGCLEAGGITVAVLGTGVDIPYPPENRQLMKRIAESGCVVSEFPPSMQGLPQNFPRRNRIISGLSSAVVVVEAPQKSGALITTNFALEQGKSVLAVPGEIWSKNSMGTLSLLRDGAAPVTETQDILDSIGLFEKRSRSEERAKTIIQPDLPPIASKLLESLDEETLHIDEISIRCGLPTSETMGELLKLEMMGFIEGRPGKYFARRRR